jgi:ribosomal protein S18 acetylase RimI-like enzyme
MRDVPGAYIGPLDVFAQKLAGKRDDVLLKSGRLAAFVSVSMQGDVGHIDMLGRHPDFRGAGLGRLLLSKGVDRLAEKGASSLALDVTTSNTAALDLYRDFGFTVESTTEVYRKTH